MKFNREYFKGEVEKMVTDVVVRKEIRRFGFLCLSKEIKEIPETKCFAIVKMLGSDVKLKIPVEQKIYDKLTVGLSVSVHLMFRYEFTCWHIENEKQETIIGVEE